MHILLSYRLIVALGLLLIQCLNRFFAIWPQAEAWTLVLGVVYLLWVMLGLKRPAQWHEQVTQVWIDLLVWALFLALHEGVSNPLVWCLLIPCMMAAIKQARWFAWLITTAANIVYVLLWFMQSVGPNHHGHDMQSHVLGMWLGFVVISVMLIWVITHLMKQIQLKNAAILAFQSQQSENRNLVRMATLATSMAHELGSPLNSIQLLSEAIQADVQNPELDQDFKLLNSQIKRCKQVLSDMTHTTQANDPLQIKTLHLKPTLLQLAQQHPSIQFHIKADEQVAFQADELLPMALNNIINNAIAAEAKNIIINHQLKDHDHMIVIKDDGLGDAAQARGLGIGLKLAKRIVETLGGELQFNRNQGGAEVSLTLPDHG